MPYSLFTSTAKYTVCVVQMFPHAYFSSGFSEQMFPQAYLLPLLLAFFLYKQQIAFRLSFRFKEKKKFTTTDVCFSLPTPRFLVKIYKEVCIRFPPFLPCLLNVI